MPKRKESVPPRPASSLAEKGEIKASHLLVSCVDHRCTNDLARVMPWIICRQSKDESEQSDQQKAAERYDHIALPGASLGVVQETFPAWREAFFQQLALALTLHPEIRTLVVADHMDCGAFRRLWPTTCDDVEREAHETVTRAFAKLVRDRHPKLVVERWLLVSDNKVDWYPVDLATGQKHTEMCCQHCV